MNTIHKIVLVYFQMLTQIPPIMEHSSISAFFFKKKMKVSSLTGLPYPNFEMGFSNFQMGYIGGTIPFRMGYVFGVRGFSLKIG